MASSPFLSPTAKVGMEKALTKVGSLNVGSLWISKKAKEEISSIGDDLSGKEAAGTAVPLPDGYRGYVLGRINRGIGRLMQLVKRSLVSGLHVLSFGTLLIGIMAVLLHVMTH